MSTLIDLSIADALAGLRQGDFLASELVTSYCDAALAARDLNCFITETFDTAQAQAKVSDERYSQGTARALEGLPIGMKDLFATTGVQ
ncbi:MAG: amidase family protein, partial [Pseudomonadota bacterium]